MAATTAAAPGFAEEQKTSSYASDATAATGDASAPDPSNWSIRMMDVFSGLRTDRAEAGNPAVMTYNDELTSRINLTASAAQRERAIVDQYGDMSLTMADGLGQRLGDIYAKAVEAGELPKTTWLLSKSGGKIGSSSSTNPPKNSFDYDRPYLRLDPTTQLTYVDKVGGDAWGSTSGAFPSGHTSQAFWQGTTLAVMLPELAPQILARTAEAGDNRIVMGAHYALDVISGRMMGQKIVQLRLADEQMRGLVAEASRELRGVLEEGCGDGLAACIVADTPYLSTEAALSSYEDRLGYDFPAIGATDAPVVVPAGAETLLTSSHPDLSNAQRRQVLALTAAPSGHPLDVGEEESWQRLDLAAAMSATVTVGADGDVSLGAPPVVPAPVPSPEPTPAPSPDPAPEPSPEPSAEPTPAPSPEPSPEPTAAGPSDGSDEPGDDVDAAPAAPASGEGSLAQTGGDTGVVWLGAGAGTVLVALGALLIRRRRALI